MEPIGDSRQRTINKMVMNKLESYSDLTIFERHFAQVRSQPQIIAFLEHVHAKFHPAQGFNEANDFFYNVWKAFTKTALVRFMEDEEARGIFLTFARMLRVMPSNLRYRRTAFRTHTDQDYYARIDRMFDLARLYQTVDEVQTLLS